MGLSKRQLHLNLNLLNSGTHAAAWRWPGSDPKAFINIEHYVHLAQVSERGLFDAIFLADFPGLPGRADLRPFQSLDPALILSAVALATQRIGLVGTISTSYSAPYDIARRFASLDHISHGRSAVNIVTSADASSALSFGFAAPLPHALRYERAAEFVDVLKALWDSWKDDALLADQSRPQFIDKNLISPLAHHGKHFTVQGALNVPRAPQGRPVLIQAGGSEDGIDLAARHADAVFTVAHTLDSAIAYAEKLRHRLHDFGRPADSVLIFPGLVTILGRTEEEAREREHELWKLSSDDSGLAWLSGLMQIDVSAFDLDKPLPEGLSIPADGIQTFTREALEKSRREQLSIRELIRAQGGGGTNHRTFVGTPDALAKSIGEWFASGAVDGFNLMPDVLPSGLELFVDEVVPLLQEQGIFRSRYEGQTLREHLSLQKPAAR